MRYAFVGQFRYAAKSSWVTTIVPPVASPFCQDRSPCGFHLNDSKKEFNSRVDRHEHIGKGHLGVEAFRLLLNDKRFWGLPMCLETPKGPDLKEDKENLALLRSLIQG